MVILIRLYLMDVNTATRKNRIKINGLKGNYGTTKKMGPPENNSKSKDSKVKVKPDAGNPQTQHRQKKPEL